jgi:hypothetical protein
MLTALFILSALAFAACVMRRPRTRWQRVGAWVAGILMLAVIVAWGIEYLMQNAHAAGLML